MFMNEYAHTIDSKGRMILPAKFREELGNTFVLSPGLDTCLTIYPLDCWKQMQEKLEKLPQTRKNVRALRRFLIGKSTEMECDRQGRILIPSHLRNYAQLGKDAKIIGGGRYDRGLESCCAGSFGRGKRSRGRYCRITGFAYGF